MRRCGTPYYETTVIFGKARQSEARKKRFGLRGRGGVECRAAKPPGFAGGCDMQRGASVNDFSIVSWIKTAGSWALLSGVVATLALSSGCKDPRISMAQFVEQGEGRQPFVSAYPGAPGADSATADDTGALIPGSPSPAQLWASRAQVPYRVGPGDVITVSMLGLNETGQPVISDLRVDKNGNVRLPIAGELNVNDMEIDDVEKAIVAKYVPSVVTSLTAHAEIRTYNMTDVVVVGAAVRPGIISLRRTNRDLLHAVAAAGGLTNVASGMVTLQRIKEPDKSVRLNLLDPVQLSSALALNPLESGDIVRIDAASANTIFVGGLVLLPGPKQFAPGESVTLMQALASAGGPREDVAPTEATLIRRRPDGTDVQVKVDLDKLRMGEEPNVLLAAGDILWVPETAGTRTMDFINKNVFFRFGATASYNVIGNATGVEYLNRRAQQSSQFSNGGTTLQNSVDPLGFLSTPGG